MQRGRPGRAASIYAKRIYAKRARAVTAAARRMPDDHYR